MLIIGHRGAAGLAPENSLEAFRAGMAADADMLEFDIQRTRDGELLVVHDTTLFRTHKKRTIIRWSKYDSIKRATEHGYKVATLEEVLDLCFGKILLNLELKHRGVAKHVMSYLEENYIKHPSDWENVLISSFLPSELVIARKMSTRAELALLHDKNPFTFMLYHRRLTLTAVGFHRLRAHSLALQVAQHLGLFTYIYTVNRPDAAKRAKARGIDAVVTDNPLMLRRALK